MFKHIPLFLLACLPLSHSASITDILSSLKTLSQKLEKSSGKSAENTLLTEPLPAPIPLSLGVSLSDAFTSDALKEVSKVKKASSQKTAVVKEDVSKIVVSTVPSAKSSVAPTLVVKRAATFPVAIAANVKVAKEPTVAVVEQAPVSFEIEAAKKNSNTKDNGNSSGNGNVNNTVNSNSNYKFVTPVPSKTLDPPVFPSPTHPTPPQPPTPSSIFSSSSLQQSKKAATPDIYAQSITNAAKAGVLVKSDKSK